MKIQKTTAQVLLTLGLLCCLSVSQAQGEPNIGSIGGVVDGNCSETAVLRQVLRQTIQLIKVKLAENCGSFA